MPVATIQAERCMAINVSLSELSAPFDMCVQIRDLRLLDAQPASSPPAILCREQAIVVNLEFIKCIITTRASPAPLAI